MKRTLHIGLGPLGQRILTETIQREVAHPLATVDSDPKLANTLVASHVKSASPSLKVLPNLDAVSDWDEIDCAIVATSSDLVRCADTFRELLSRGKAVIST